MREAKAIAGVAAVALAAIVGWQIASCELANYQFRDDLRDTAVQNGAKIGLTAPASDADLRSDVIRIAKDRGIQLSPDQVTVQRSTDGAAYGASTDAGSPAMPAIFLAADYEAHIKLPGVSFPLHFHPSSAK